MIVIIGGMPRAGSRWYHRLIHEMMVEAGYPDDDDLRERYGSKLPDRFMTPFFNMGKMIKFDRLARQGATFPIKTHTAPFPSILFYLSTGRFKGAYIYRDPRDIIVSALERGKIMREKGYAKRYFGFGPYRSFARLYTVQGAIQWFKWQQFPRWLRWKRCKNVMMTKYENLSADGITELKRLRDFFQFNVPDEKIPKIIDKFQPGNIPQRWEYKSQGGGFIYNKGIVGRFQKTLSPQELELCNRKLGKCLRLMGYTV